MPPLPREHRLPSPNCARQFYVGPCAADQLRRPHANRTLRNPRYAWGSDKEFMVNILEMACCDAESGEQRGGVERGDGDGGREEVAVSRVIPPYPRTLKSQGRSS